MRIGIDLDDTVCNTTKLINDFAKAYAYDKNMKTSGVLRYWDKKGITQEVYDSYFSIIKKH